jgi:hypothetical protein
MELLKDFFDDGDLDKKIWRYLDLVKLESIFESGTLYFASAEQFSANDLHEGAITENEYLLRKESIERHKIGRYAVQKHLEDLHDAFKPLRKYAKISCWHVNEKENMAMWLNYNGTDKGIVLQSTPRKLLNEVGPYRIEPDYGPETIYMGNVKYINYESDDMNSRFGFLTPFLYKRYHYEYEQELRMIISLRLATEYGVPIPETGIRVPFNYKAGIEKLILSPAEDRAYINQVEKLLLKYNIEMDMEHSRVAKPPKY